MPKEQKCDKALIWTLPDEALLVVLKNLGDKRDRQSWCVVCKKFQDLEAGDRKIVRLMRADILEPVLRRYHHVERLSMHWCLEVKDVCLVTVAKFTSQRLMSISLGGAVGFGAVGVRSLLECTSLREVDLSLCTQVRDEEVIALSELQHLQMLDLGGCDNVTDVGVSALSNCKELETLDLSFCRGIGDVGFQNIATGCLKLRNIKLSHTEVSDKGLASLALLRNVECLELQSCPKVTDKGLELLKSGCTTLQKLNVSWSEFNGHGLAALTERSEQLQKLDLSFCKLTTNMLFSNLQKLKTLMMDGCSFDESDLSLVGRGSRGLKMLSLRCCKGVIDDGVVGIVTTHTDLQELDLGCCHNITDVALEAVVTNCKGLLSLKMDKCLSVTAKGLVLIGKFLVSLNHLDLEGCKLNDDGLKSISRCIELRSLHVNSCMDITNAGLVHISATCKKLLVFHCSRSRGVGDEGVAAMASGCRRLKRVIASYCDSVTDASLQSLASIRDLQALKLRACKQVTSVGICHIAASCKHMQELDVQQCNLVGDPGVLALSHGCQDLREINLLYTAVTNVGMMAVASMPCLQYMVLGHMKVSTDCVANVVLTCGCLKDLTLPRGLLLALPPEVIKQLKERGTWVRQMDKSDLLLVS